MSPTRQRILHALPAAFLLILPFALLQIDAVRGAMVALVAYMRVAGLLGLCAFFGVEVVATMITTPLWMMSGVAGYVYGFPAGFFVALPGVTFASCVCFVLGRALLRRTLEKRLGDNRYVAALNRTAETEGLKITLLIRLTFAMPQNLLSYLLATTPLRLRTFALGTFVGLAPATLFHVYLGSMVPSAAALLAGEAKAQGPLGWVAAVIGLVMTAGGLFLTSRMAKRALERALRGPADASAEVDLSAVP